MSDSWLGLRPEELTVEQRRRLEEEPELREMHVRELDLGRRLSLPPAASERPNVRDVFSRAQYATQTLSRLRGTAGGNPLAVSLPILALVAGLWVYTWIGGEMPWEGGATQSTQTRKTVDPLGGPVGVRMNTVAVALMGMRPLQDGGVIETPESPQFSVQVTGDGYLVILDVTDGIRPLYPSLDPSSWRVDDGIHKPAEDLRIARPRPNESKNRSYRALLCERPPWVVEEVMPEGCIFHDVTLTWR